MALMKARLIEVIKEELNRQGQISKSCGLYIYGDDESNEEIGVDGMLDLQQFADAILKFIEESRAN